MWTPRESPPRLRTDLKYWPQTFLVKGPEFIGSECGVIYAPETASNQPAISGA